MEQKDGNEMRSGQSIMTTYHMDYNDEVHAVVVLITVVIGFLCVVAFIFILRLVWFYLTTDNSEKAFELDIESNALSSMSVRERNVSERSRREESIRSTSGTLIDDESAERCAPSTREMVDIVISRKTPDDKAKQEGVIVKTLPPPPDYSKIPKCEILRIGGLTKPRRIVLTRPELPEEQKTTWPSAEEFSKMIERTKHAELSATTTTADRTKHADVVAMTVTADQLKTAKLSSVTACRTPQQKPTSSGSEGAALTGSSFATIDSAAHPLAAAPESSKTSTFTTIASRQSLDGKAVPVPQQSTQSLAPLSVSSVPITSGSTSGQAPTSTTSTSANAASVQTAKPQRSAASPRRMMGRRSSSLRQTSTTPRQKTGKSLPSSRSLSGSDASAKVSKSSRKAIPSSK